MILSLLETVKFDMAYMFAYSMRKVNNVYYTHMLIKNIKYEKYACTLTSSTSMSMKMIVYVTL